MTYCLGIVTKHGLVMASDSRTNSGTDQVSVCRKMFWFEKPGERVFIVLTSGGLSIALDRLERVDYVHRFQHPDDRRRVIVEASETLAPLEREVFATLQQRFSKMLRGYTREQLLTIKHYLEAAAEITREAP